MEDYKDKINPSEEVKEEQYSLNDDRRVRVLSPGALVAKRFFRNRLAVTGMVILVAMFIFCWRTIKRAAERDTYLSAPVDGLHWR